MNENKNITPYNNKQQRHGYWQMYWGFDEALAFKRYYLNGQESGYEEEHYTNNIEITFYL